MAEAWGQTCQTVPANEKKAGTSTAGGGAIWQTSILRDGEIWGQPHYYLWKIPFYLKGWDGFEGCERFIKIVWNPLDGSGKDRWVALFLRACLYLGNSLSTLQVAPWSVFVTTSPQAVVEKSTVLGMKSLQASSLRYPSHRWFPIWLFGTPQRGECWTFRPLPQKECRKKLFLAMNTCRGKVEMKDMSKIICDSSSFWKNSFITSFNGTCFGCVLFNHCFLLRASEVLKQMLSSWTEALMIPIPTIVGEGLGLAFSSLKVAPRITLCINMPEWLFYVILFGYKNCEKFGRFGNFMFFLSMISSCCLVTTCINLEYYSESRRTLPAFSLAPQYLQGSSWRAASFGTRSSGRLGWNGRWAWLGEEEFSKRCPHTLGDSRVGFGCTSWRSLVLLQQVLHVCI